MDNMVARVSEKWQKEFTSKFDIDLKFGESFEYSLARILTLGKVEVKTERDKWVKTGNIAIELMNQGNASGLSVTEAEWWAHILSFKGSIKSVILLPVKELKKKVKESVHNGNGRIVMGGDDNCSEIALIPIKEIHLK
jgi:F0F1-type ATP synthase alpha subunit